MRDNNIGVGNVLDQRNPTRGRASFLVYRRCRFDSRPGAYMQDLGPGTTQIYIRGLVAQGGSGFPVATYFGEAVTSVLMAVTVFRGAYEQVGNTVALWADVGIDRHAAAAVIPMTWFQSLNPLLVFLMTPLLLAQWHRRSERGTEPSAMRKMASGAFIVALAYSLLAVVSVLAGPNSASWIWLALFFVIFTLGELHILPTGLGLFARLAPANLAATTVAAWFLAIFTGSLTAGAVGTLWSSVPHAEFFAILALLAVAAACMLLTMDRETCRIETALAAELAAIKPTHVPGP